MNLNLPKEYDPEEIARIVVEALQKVENDADRANVMNEITSVKLSSKDRELQPFFRRNGTAREIVFSDKGKTFKITATEV